MSEPDPILARLRDLPSPSIDAPTRARTLRAAERELRGGHEAPRAPLARAWSSWGLTAMLLAAEAVYLADFFGKLRLVFFG